jgi:hypothetical protein
MCFGQRRSSCRRTNIVRLLAAADKSDDFKGSAFDSCSLINARSGLCGRLLCALIKPSRGCELYPWFRRPECRVMAAHEKACFAGY